MAVVADYSRLRTEEARSRSLVCGDVDRHFVVCNFLRVLDIDVGVQSDTCEIGKVVFGIGNVVLHLEDAGQFSLTFNRLDIVVLLGEVAVDGICRGAGVRAFGGDFRYAILVDAKCRRNHDDRLADVLGCTLVYVSFGCCVSSATCVECRRCICGRLCSSGCGRSIAVELIVGTFGSLACCCGLLTGIGIVALYSVGGRTGRFG